MITEMLSSTNTYISLFLSKEVNQKITQKTTILDSEVYKALGKKE